MQDPKTEQKKLDDLQHRIDDTREAVNNGTELDDEQQFIDSGTREENKIDDSIAPG